MGYFLAALLLWTLIGLILTIRSLGNATMTASPGELFALVLLWPLHLRFFAVMVAADKFLKEMKKINERIEGERNG